MEAEGGARIVRHLFESYNVFVEELQYATF
jgi:hypothetical protein